MSDCKHTPFEGQNDQVAWGPNLFPKQRLVFDDYHRFLLVSGPRIAGKTHGILHKVTRHLWDVPGANFGIFAKTVKSATQFGVWDMLHKHIIPEWLKANIGLEYVTENSSGNPGPKTDNTTRTLYFGIKNRWYDELGIYGGISECRLYSCDCCEEVEEKTKSMVFSGIYFSELSNFENRMVFSGTTPLLRPYPGVTYEMEQWMSDTNPSEEGEDSWIYDIFYRERTMENHEDPEYQRNIGLIEIFMNDNPYVTERQKKDIMGNCHYDPTLYDRYVNGLWTKGGLLERHFAKVFVPNIHILGQCDAPDESNWEVLMPSEHCQELVTCWDMGDVNHAGQIMERVTDREGRILFFAVLDELVYIKDDVGTEEFALQMLEKMNYWEGAIGHPVNWLHYSDDNALKQWKASIKGVDASLVRQVSKDKIILQGCPKEPESVRARVQLVKRLLFQNKLFFSAKCPTTIDAIRELRVSKKDFIQRMNNKHKHPFDSLSYGLTMCTLDDLEYSHEPTTARTGLLMAS